MICQTCQSTNNEQARFCQSCGAALAVSSGLPAGHETNIDVTDDEVTRVREPFPKGPGSSSAGVSNHNDTLKDPLTGRTIEGKYRIEAKLGAGGMGAVYRATRLVIGDEVAIKILHSEQNEPRAGERFRREAQAAARLKHPNAVNIYDFGVTDDGLQYLVMELVEGESLRRIIKQQGPLTPTAAAEIVSQVCAALDEAHRRQIIHRDIKPDNIIVDVSANRLRVKVLDFGIAKLRDDTAGNLTQTGSVLGTPHYMSPEQCLGEELDSRSDIYSLGIVLYEMLAGVVPFNSPISTAVVVQHVNQPPPSLRATNLSISANVERVVMHALAKKRENRQQTAGELAEELTRVTSSSSPRWANNRFPASSTEDSEGTPTVVLPTSRSGSVESPGIPTSDDLPRKKLMQVMFGAIVVTSVISLAIWMGTKTTGEDKTRNLNLNATRQGENQRSASVIEEPEADRFVEGWREAWESKDLYNYSNCYDEDFVGRNFSARTGFTSMTRAQWINDKERKFRNARSLSVGIGQRTIKDEGNEVSVSFDQTFRSDKYYDNGRKTLYLRRGSNGQIKIVREDFVPDTGNL